MYDRPGDILELTEHNDYLQAVPTPDHFIPLLHIAALAAASGQRPNVLIDGFTYGSLSMTSYTLGVDCPDADDDRAAAGLPGPEIAPTDETNT